jgi:hypothetical protein
MTSHGVPVSVSAGSGGQGVSMSAGAGGQVPFDKNSPQFASAQRACAKLLPGGGPGNETQAEAAQSRVAELALARCMRRHGYPNFPDPTGQGVLNLSNAGIDPRSSEFQSTKQTCGPKGKGGGPVRIFDGPPGSTPP